MTTHTIGDSRGDKCNPGVYGWIDGTDAGTDGVWLAGSGEEMLYIGFTLGEPNGGNGENCLAVGTNDILDFICDGRSDMQYTLGEI